MRTWNRYISLALLALRIRKEDHHQLATIPAQNAQVLADALLAPAFGLGLCDAGDEGQFGGQDEFLELQAVVPVFEGVRDLRCEDGGPGLDGLFVEEGDAQGWLGADFRVFEVGDGEARCYN